MPVLCVLLKLFLRPDASEQPGTGATHVNVFLDIRGQPLVFFVVGAVVGGARPCVES